MSDKINFTKEMIDFFLNDSVERFLRYVQIETTADETSLSVPSNPKEFDLAHLLAKELKELGLEDVEVDEHCYVYAYLPASKGYEKAEKINLIAHLDTSSDSSGKDVKPIIHKNYDGKSIIKYPLNKDLELSPEISPYLKECAGMDIITSSGDTLLGADDKAGISEIMTACASFKKFSELKHCAIQICFTPDEEISRGTDHINEKKLGKIGYTLEGDEMGYLNSQCFDAWRANLKFIGISNHPGTSKNRMVNAIKIASLFVSNLPDAESPEHTEGFEGFYHIVGMQGEVEEATLFIIIRDFKEENNLKRIEFIKSLIHTFELKYPKLKIELETIHSYKNMKIYLDEYPEVVGKAWKSIEDAGLVVINQPIRGGTDGARLCERGYPTPNIFAGGLLFHSKREYIPTKALQKAVEVIIRLANHWIC